MKVRVSYRIAAALAHWRKCEDCRETREGAIDDAIGCLSPEFVPINERMGLLQEEYAALEAEKARLIALPIPKRLKG